MKYLEITPDVGCKNMCVYCPQDKFLKAYKDKKKHMNFEDFKRMMANVPKDVTIDFAGFSEPFFNKEASLMMRWCIDNGYITWLYTTLKGFTDADLEILKGATFHDVIFHKYDGHGFDLEEFNTKMEKWKANIKSKGIYRLAIVNQTGHGEGVPLWSRAGNLFDRPITKGSFYCSASPDGFNHNIVMPNGDVYICCMDWSLKHPMGNLYETHYDDLDRKTVTDLSNKGMSDIICRKCELITERYPIPLKWFQEKK